MQINHWDLNQLKSNNVYVIKSVGFIRTQQQHKAFWYFGRPVRKLVFSIWEAVHLCDLVQRGGEELSSAELRKAGPKTPVV